MPFEIKTFIIEKRLRLGSCGSAYEVRLLTLSYRGATMLWTILIILVILWLLGFIGGVGGNLIHIILVIAVIVLIVNLVQGRRVV